MPQKSEARHELARLFSGAFNSGCVSLGRDFDVAFEDGLQALKSIGNGLLDTCNECPKLRTADDIFEATKRSAEQALNYTNCSTYCFLFDKYKYVPMAKGHEQSLRDNKRSTEEQECESEPKNKNGKRTKKPEPDRTPLDGKPHRKRRPYLVSGMPIPRDVRLAIHDRDDSLPHIISLQCMEWISLGSPHCLNIPQFKRVIIDGHCLTLEMAKTCGVGGKYPASDKDAYQTPILVGDPFGNSDNKSFAIWCPEFKNQHGEADSCTFFLLEHLIGKYPHRIHAEIYSNDTDMLNLSLIELDKRGSEAPYIHWRFAPHPSWVFFTKLINSDTSKWADMNRLAQLISCGQFDRMAPPGRNKSKKIKEKHEELLRTMSIDDMDDKKRAHEGDQQKFTGLKYPLLSFVVAVLTAKSDYTDGIKGITHERFFSAMIQYADYIGDLIDISEDYGYGISINGGALCRLYKTAYMLAKSERFKKDKNNKGEIMHPSTISLKTIRSMTSSLAEMNQFPSDDYILQSGKHLRYLMILYYQVGKSPRILEPNPLNYGYYPRDPTLPLSRNNIRR